jgi:hypothetical protein
MPSLAIALFTISRCLFIIHLCEPSGMVPTIVVIFDRCAPEHGASIEDAGLMANAQVATTVARAIAIFMMDSVGRTQRIPRHIRQFGKIVRKFGPRIDVNQMRNANRQR